ncbi:acyltransferase family protein [Microbacterium sp. AK031]|uniref:acyltransferase family protein n=1 Tax=Microbacterium sp. AK031 TaxID=2723076 RepID=UPI00216913DD|nr:acyltransferase family protein [Microbacterium sp. AK031]MCS3842107.1 peptidoglycan/LPS O-acetylase OafA/YrhL [Microbacterium sp. AK031]
MLQTTESDQSIAEASAGSKAMKYRADIDGLRALAILLVVVYHVWLGRVSGGVDVFLMISSFFLTASFVRRVQSGTPMRLGQFWARRFRRLLPAAAVTIVGVLATAIVVYPQTEWPRVWREAWASLFYSENWALASSEVDYYARDAVTPSPFQHFWSLSVQGQVFLLWPLLIGMIAFVLRTRRRLIVPALFIAFTLVFAVSLAFSIYETNTSQSFAYFDTRTRLWEFAAGSLVAIALPFVRLPALVRVVLGWAGVLGIVMCGVVLDVQGGFPGYLALWPVVCTAFVIIGGDEDVRGGPGRLLSSRIVAFVGRDAYALYLVHWPILVTWMITSGRAEPGWFAGLAIILVSMVLARLISRFVENPLRNAPVFDRSPRSGLLVIVCAALLVAVPLASWQVAQKIHEDAVAEATGSAYPGAAQVDDPIDLESIDVPLKPVATTLGDEWVSFGDDCSGAFAPRDALLAGSCQQNDMVAERDRPQILVMGDSHAQQLSAPLQVLAEERDWGVTALLKGGCPIGIGAPSWSADGVPCEEWRQAAVEYAKNLKPDAVYLVVTRAGPDAEEVVVEGISEVVDSLEREGISVIGVRDNPRFDFDMYECALSDESCDVTPPAIDTSELKHLADRVIFVDFNRWLCPDDTCTGEVGNVAVFIDDNHISATYGRTLAPMLGDKLTASGFRW